ncbi:hypothetical protein BHE90_014785 [Fusarium euwallaceae]|uniref:Uncharacterized protein n=1 Tax=Fusarium euwallaceae TaxID=1147111 RepID=A0A430L506_9HYPO|nr:hypothetical protein BHE90_014785 [Fusarium euwallaceae]
MQYRPIADENIEGIKEDLARLTTGLATLDGLLGDPGLLQHSNTQNAASHRTALPGGPRGPNGSHGKDNGIATSQIDFAVFLSRVKTEVENFRSGLVSLQSRIEEQEMICAGPPEEDAEEDAEGETEGAEGNIIYQYHAAIEDVVTPQLLQPVSGRDHEPEVDSERALEVSEAPKGKRKAGLHTANTKK